MPALNAPGPSNRPVRSFNSLGDIEEELANVERRMAAYRDSLKQAHSQSSADDAALRAMGTRTKEIMGRPKTWRGGSKRSDADELDSLRSEIRSRSEVMDRNMQAMRAMSAEARELAQRQKELSTRRAEILRQI